MPRRVSRPESIESVAALQSAVLAFKHLQDAASLLDAALPVLAVAQDTRADYLLEKFEEIFGALTNARTKIGAVMGVLHQVKNENPSTTGSK